MPEFFRIMTRQFTAHEWSVIQSSGSEYQQLAAFYRHWVTMATALLCGHVALLLGPTGGVVLNFVYCIGNSNTKGEKQEKLHKYIRVSLSLPLPFSQSLSLFLSLSVFHSHKHTHMIEKYTVMLSCM